MHNSPSRRGSRGAQGTDSAPQPSSSATALRRRLPSGKILVALVSIAVLLVTGYAWNSLTTLEDKVSRLGGLSLGNGADGAVDILLVGTDSRVDAQGNPLSPKEAARLHAGDEVASNTDTIMVMRIPNDGSSATAMSIPRDSYVDVPDIGKIKINSAYGSTREKVREQQVNAGVDEQTAEKRGTEAGRKALVDTVANLTGVQVDHYAEVGLVGFVLLTDAVGGVDVCLKHSVNEPLSGAHFRAGQQTLDGPEALSFVRQRHRLPRQDLDRIVRQQVFMASLAHKVLSAGTLASPSKLSNLETAVSRSVVIDDKWDIIKFVAQLKDLTGGKVRFSTIPVQDEQGWSDDGEQSVVRVDPAAVHNFTASLLTSKSKKKTALDRSEYTVDVVNAGSVDGLAGNVSDIVAGRGFSKGTASNADKPADAAAASTILTSSKNAGASDLAAQLGNVAVRVDSSIPDGHLRLVLTENYAGPGSISDVGRQPSTTASSQSSASSQTSTAPKVSAVTAASDGPQCVN